MQHGKQPFGALAQRTQEGLAHVGTLAADRHGHRVQGGGLVRDVPGNQPGGRVSARRAERRQIERAGRIEADGPHRSDRPVVQARDRGILLAPFRPVLALEEFRAPVDVNPFKTHVVLG